MVLGKLGIQMQKNEVGPLPHTMQNLIQNGGLNLKAKTQEKTQQDILMSLDLTVISWICYQKRRQQRTK